MSPHPEIYHRIHRSSYITFLDKEHPYREMPLRILGIMVSPGTYECIITNLPSGSFPAKEIKKIYKMRWGIETSFRELKYAIGYHASTQKKRNTSSRKSLQGYSCIISVKLSPLNN